MKKKLRRDQERAVVAGVLSGLADFFDHDRVLYRVLAVSFLVLTGVFPGLLLYIGAWVVMPKKVDSEARDVEYKVVE